jgi:TatD DNase family protein
VPLDRILVETDAPYLAPIPYRSKINRSDYIEYTIRTIAELHELPEEEIRDRTHANACKLFSI